jgi:hypothetical protein
MGSASAYAAVLPSIDSDVAKLMASNPDIFTFSDLNDGLVDVRDSRAPASSRCLMARRSTASSPGSGTSSGTVSRCP